jgi:hypothetical protein
MIGMYISANDVSNHVVQVWINEGNHNSLIAGPYIWNSISGFQGWNEFEFPSAIEIKTNRNYIISIINSADLNVSNTEYFNSITSNITLRSSNENNISDQENLSTMDWHINNSVRIAVAPELNPGSIGSDQRICYNTVPASLKVLSTPSGGTGIYIYQWQVSNDNDSWWDINGANGATFTPGPLKLNTWYRCKITSGNFRFETTNIVRITVTEKPTAGSIGTDQTICYNTRPLTLSQITSTPDGAADYVYQWQSSPDNINWTDINGATNLDFSPPPLSASLWYRRKVSSGNCASVFTNSVRITVYPSLIAGTLGINQTICYNTQPDQLTQITVPSGGSGTYLYQWQSSPDNNNWTNIEGATSVSYTPTALTSERWYRRNVVSGPCTATSNIVHISVYPDLKSGTIENDQTICFNTIPVSLVQIASPSGGTGTYSYQWQISSDNTSWTNISNANSTVYSPPALTSSRWYRLNVLSGCTTNSNLIRITVYPSLSAGTLGTNQNICYNTQPDQLTQITAPSGGSGTYLYQWQSSPDNNNWTNIEGATSVSYIPTALTSERWYRRNVGSGSCIATSNIVHISVSPDLKSGTIENDQTICFNTIPASLVQIASPSGGTGAYSYQWQSSSDNSSWTNISNANSEGYSPPALTSSRWYRRNVISGCTASSNSVRITLYSQISSAQLHDSKTIYENTSTTFNIAISGSNPPYTVNYTINGSKQPEISDYISETELPTGVLAKGTYTFSLTSVTDSHGCLAQSLGTGIIINVTEVQNTNGSKKALIIVNSASSYYSNYSNYIVPYLDNFGIPYDVCNINTSQLPSFNNYAVLIFGHKNVYSSGYPIAQLEDAVYNGVGLYSFDSHLFDYASEFNTLISQRSVNSSTINISNTSHFITQYHAPDTYNTTNNVISLLRSWSLSQTSNLIGAVNLASMSSGGQTISLLQAASYGNGRIVKWCGYDWIFENYLGPVYGMDDLIWRGIVWAARKPFVMQGLPPMVTMRVDDVEGFNGGATDHFIWIQICNEFGIKPWCGTYYTNIRTSDIPILKGLVDNNLATSSPHAINGFDFIYFNHNGLSTFDAAANVRNARNFYIQNSLKISKYVVPHFYELSSQALGELHAMGAEFIGIHMRPDNFYSSETPWLNCEPYRINRYGYAHDDVRPVFYGGYVNLSGIEFFNCVVEIRDDGGYEWFPDNNVTTTTARGIRHLRRSFNSMVLASLFTHEYFLEEITINNWREIIRQITSNISGYNPEYCSMDYAIQYIRAKNNIKITDVVENSSNIEIHYSGSNDLNTKCYLFSENNGQITYKLVSLPEINGSSMVNVLK